MFRLQSRARQEDPEQARLKQKAKEVRFSLRPAGQTGATTPQNLVAQIQDGRRVIRVAELFVFRIDRWAICSKNRQNKQLKTPNSLHLLTERIGKSKENLYIVELGA